MKKVIYLLIIFISGIASGAPNTHNTYFGRPLFNYAVDKNRLPQGNYRVVRSHKKITQLLVSSRWQVRTLYYDRNNRTDSSIYVSSMALYKQVFIEEKPVDQAVFNTLVAKAIVSGDRGRLQTHNYFGLEQCEKMIKNGSGKLTRTGSVFTIHVKAANGKMVPIMVMDHVYKSLVINYYFSAEGEVIVPPDDALKDEYYIKPVVVFETKDPGIIAIINDYASRFYDHLKKL